MVHLLPAQVQVSIAIDAPQARQVGPRPAVLPLGDRSEVPSTGAP
jgi:hypothetical protein